MIFDLRRGVTPLGKDPVTGKAIRAIAIDVLTGERVPKVFYYNTETHQVGRFALNEKGLLSAVPVWEIRRLRFEPVVGNQEAPTLIYKAN